MPTFTASRVSSGENTVFPDKLEIDAVKVVYYKGTLIGYRSTVLALNHIASVHIVSRIFFADVVIETVGGRRVVATGLTKSDARSIVSLISP